MNQILEQISKIGIVPVIALNDAKDAGPLAAALCKGGLNCAEVTFRTEAAAGAIRAMAAGFPDMLVGAGTVLTTEQVDQATAAGARFIVSPGLNPRVVRYCVEREIPVIPGCANPSDVEQAIELGLDTVKFFPAKAAGGVAMIKAMSAPYPKMKFMPTGGITAKNLKEYLNFDKIIACGGSWMVKSDLVEAGDFEQITALTAEAVNSMLGFECKHIGINSADDGEAQATAAAFCDLFGFVRKDGNSSVFADSGIEVMKAPYLGARGHIGVGTNYIERAVYHLEQRGVVFNHDSARYDANGKLTVIYLEREIGGFAVHLIRS